eukprot:1051698-Pyramimonas_sp.AAC.1
MAQAGRVNRHRGGLRGPGHLPERRPWDRWARLQHAGRLRPSSTTTRQSKMTQATGYVITFR